MQVSNVLLIDFQVDKAVRISLWRDNAFVESLLAWNNVRTDWWNVGRAAHRRMYRQMFVGNPTELNTKNSRPKSIFITKLLGGYLTRIPGSQKLSVVSSYPNLPKVLKTLIPAD